MTHEETFSLLVPRYLRGELSPTDKAEFESYMAENPDFQADIEFQRNLMSARSDDLADAGFEFGWARLSRSIDALDSETLRPLQAETLPKTASGFRGLWKIAAVALACLSAGQALYIINSAPSEHLQLASEKDAFGTMLQVSFLPDTKAATISNFLIDHHAEVIGGPGKLGIYTLSFSDNKNCANAINTLNSEEQFVETYTSCSTNSGN